MFFFRVKVHGSVHRYPPTDAWACLQVFTVFKHKKSTLDALGYQQGITVYIAFYSFTLIVD